MEREIVSLLLEQKVVSAEFADELKDIDGNKLLASLEKFALEETEKINEESIEKFLETDYVGRDFYCFPKAFSTNTLAKFFASQGAKDGTAVVAEVQTKARGRSGKKWESPKGGIWLSLVLKPNLPPSKASLITLATGVAVAKTLREVGVDAKIKWPNDVLVNGKKISGILTEASATLNDIDYIIVGVGIDTNFKLEDLNDSDLQNIVTTLSEEMGCEIDENQVIATFLNQFEEVYDKFKSGEVEDILNDWRLFSGTIGEYVEIRHPLGNINYGYAVGINKEGCLIIEEADGTLEKIISGECRTKSNKYM